MNNTHRLGTKVFCFDMTNHKTITEGFICSVEMSEGGRIQYRVKTHIGDFLASEHCVALTLASCEDKQKAFQKLLDEQRAMTDSFFGTPDFDMKELTKDFPKVEKAEQEVIEPQD